MGFFKDLRDINKAGKDMVKERGGHLQMMKDGVAQANQVMQQVQTGQALAERLANEGVDGSATINQVVPPTIILQPGATVPVKVDPNDHSQLLIALAG